MVPQSYVSVTALDSVKIDCLDLCTVDIDLY